MFGLSPPLVRRLTLVLATRRHHRLVERTVSGFAARAEARHTRALLITGGQ